MIEDEIFTTTQSLKSILNVKPLRLTKDVIAQSMNYNKTIKSAVDNFIVPKVREEPETIQIKDLVWIKEALKDLNPGLYIEDISEQLMRAEFPISIAEELAGKVAFLRDNVPVLGPMPTSFIMMEQHPTASISNDIRFMWVCRVVDNPLQIIGLMSKNMLTKYDVQ